MNNSNELIINFVWETEELKHTEVQIGQKVLSIDNKVFKKLSNADLCELKNYLKEVSKIKITIQMESEPKELELCKSIN